MARIDTLGNFLTDVATAIKDKKGDQTPIKASDFDTEITNLPSGGGGTGFTGNVDAEGLRQIGWTDEDIQYFQKNGVQWNETEDDIFVLSDDELLGIDSVNLRFINGNSTKTSYGSFPKLLGLPSRAASYITNASAFMNCYSLTTIPLFNTSSMMSFNAMFSNCCSLRTIPLLDTSEGTNFGTMFSNCYSLRTIPLLNTGKGTNFASMFQYCYALEAIPLINTINGTTFESMFQNCYSLTTIPLLDTSKAKSFNSMFSYCYSLKAIPLLDTSKATGMSNMFAQCRSLKTIPLLDTHSVTNMGSMFSNCYSLTSVPKLDLTKVTNMSSMFRECSLLEEIDLSTKDFSNVTSFSNMFYSCGSKLPAGQLTKIYVKDANAQNWVLTANNGHPSDWTTDNVIIAGSEQDLRPREE